MSDAAGSPGALRFLGRDRLARATLAVFAMGSLALLAPLPRVEDAWYVCLLALTAALLRHRRRALPGAAERDFWGDLGVGLGCWLLHAALYLLLSRPTIYASLPLQVLIDLLQLLYYLALVAASERRPDRVPAPPGARDETLERAALSVFGVALFVYFVAIPNAVGAEVAGSGLTLGGYSLFLTFDLYLLGRFAFLSLRTPSRRWRALYGILAFAMVVATATDLMELLGQHPAWGFQVPRALWPLWYVPILAVALAARLRDHRSPLADAREQWPQLDQRPPRLIVYPLALTLVHLVVDLAGVQPALRGLRDPLVLAALAALAGLAHLRYRRLDRRNEALVAELAGSLEEQRRAEAEERRAEGEAREALERAERTSRGKGEFLASMSRELRTPLDGVLTSARVLEADRGLSDSQRSAARTVRTSGEHLITLIGDVVELAELESGRLELRDRPFALPPLLETLAEMFRPRAEAKGLAFRYEPGPGLPPRVRGDERRLRQVLINLLANAIKFTPKGEVALRARASQGVLRFEVADTGPGIPPGEQARILEPFERGASAPDAEGTGLGLAISRTLVARMGGALELRSEPGRGSSFAFALALPALAPPAASPEGARPEPAAASRPAPVDAPPSGAPEGPAPDAAFTEAELARLRGLAQRGDVRRLLEETRRVQKARPAAAPLARELFGLARSFQLRRLRERLDELSGARTET